MGFSCLFITHDLSTVEFLCDRVAVMYLGRIVELAPRDAALRRRRSTPTRRRCSRPRSCPTRRCSARGAGSCSPATCRARSRRPPAAPSAPAARSRSRAAPRRCRRCAASAATRSPATSSAPAARRRGSCRTSRMSFTTRPELRGTFGMVASTHWLASAAGMAVLERGGNAFDAAVAAGLTLQVVEPHLNGPGGDLPAVFWSAERGEPLVLCAQGPAPAAATIDRYRALGLDLVPGPDSSPPVSPARSTAGCCSCATSAPGGSPTCSSSRSATPRTATRPCPASPARSHAVEEQLREWPASAALYLPPPRARRALPQPASSRRPTGGSSTSPAAARARTRSSARAASGTAASSPTPSTASAPRTSGLLTGRRPRGLARDARVAAHARLPRLHRLQGGPVEPGARCSCSSSRCSTASTSRRWASARPSSSTP